MNPYVPIENFKKKTRIILRKIYKHWLYELTNEKIKKREFAKK